MQLRPFQYNQDHLNGLVMEAIRFQDGSLFRALTAEIEEIASMEPADAVKAFSDGRIRKLVFNATGMDIYFFVAGTYKQNKSMRNFNAMVQPPDITKNNVLHVDWAPKNWLADSDARKVLRKAKEITVGSVDLVNGRVSGVFSKMTMRSSITVDLLMERDIVTSAQKAAVMLHELGHGFTWIEMIAESACFDMAIMTVQRELQGVEDETKRIQLALAVNDCLNVEVDTKMMAESDDVTTWYTVYLKNRQEERRKASNAGYYTDVASEFLADQFAVRHGAGEALAGAMTAIYQYYGSASTESTASAWIGFAANVLVWGGLILGAGAAGPVGLGVSLASLLFLGSIIALDPNYGYYDWDKERVRKMRNEMTSQLKNRELPDDIKRNILASVKRVDALLNELNDNKSFYQVAAIVFNSTARRNVRQRDIQNALSDLLNNPLFAKAAAISTIGQA